MNINNELNCVDLIRAVIRIQDLCAKRGCMNCTFCESYDYHFCKINFPFEWETDSLNKWLKEHESEGTKINGKKG